MDESWSAKRIPTQIANGWQACSKRTVSVREKVVCGLQRGSSDQLVQLAWNEPVSCVKRSFDHNVEADEDSSRLEGLIEGSANLKWTVWGEKRTCCGWGQPGRMRLGNYPASLVRPPGAKRIICFVDMRFNPVSSLIRISIGDSLGFNQFVTAPTLRSLQLIIATVFH